jgi:type I restriction enzyme S subunit
MLGSTGTHMPRASWDFITRMPIGLPEPQVISTAAAITSPMRLQYWALRAENEHLTRTRDELLPLLMSGRISVVEVAA